MSQARRQTLSFLLCAAVLLGAGYSWGYAAAYQRFYSPEAALDRELLHMDLNSTVLHYLNARQPEQCRAKLVRALEQQTVFVGGQLQAGPPPASRAQAAASLKRARETLKSLSASGN